MAMYGTMAAGALARRELVRSWRQPTRAIGVLGTAVLMWALLGGGFAQSFRMPGTGIGDEGVGYASYLFPGIVTLIVIFGTVFTAISLIQDRQAGFLQAVLVSPTPRWTVVASKVGSGVVTALVEGGLLLLVGLASGVVKAGPIGVLGAMVSIAFTAAAVVSLGLALAWWVDSVAGFHGMMNVVLTPMWMLSGALFPASGAHGWLATVMRINPLEWATRTMGASLGVGTAGVLDWVGTVAFAMAMMALAIGVVKRGSR